MKDKKKRLGGPLTASEQLLASSFGEFHTNHVQERKAAKDAQLRSQRSVSSELADISGVSLRRTIAGRRRRGDKGPVKDVEVTVEGVPERFGLKAAFSKRTSAKNDAVPKHIISAAKSIFNQGASGGTKRSPDKAYEDLLPQICNDWKSRMLVTPTKIKEWFAAWTTELKKTTRAVAAARRDSAPDEPQVPDEQQASEIAAELWRESQQEGIIAVAQEGLDSHADPRSMVDQDHS